MTNKPLVGVGCLVISGFLAMVLYPVFQAAKGRDGKNSACMSNLKQLGSAMSMYKDDNNEMLCSRHWMTNLFPYAKDWSKFVCTLVENPHRAKQPAQFGYAMNSALVGANAADVPENTVLFFESDILTPNLAADPNVRSGRHMGRSNVLFANLTVRRKLASETLRSKP